MFLSVAPAHYRGGAVAPLRVCVVYATDVLHSNVRTYCMLYVHLKIELSIV